MVCPFCSKKFPKDAVRCPKCGKRLRRTSGESHGTRKKKQDIATPLLIGMLVTNLVISAGIITVMTSKSIEPVSVSQPAAAVNESDIAEQTLAPAPQADPPVTVQVPPPSELQVQQDQPETIDRYLLAPKLRFGMDLQSAQEAVMTMNPAETDPTPVTSDTVTGYTYYFDRGTIALGQYAQTDMPVRMTLYFKNDRLYQYALVFGQNQNRSVSASAIDAGSMFTTLYNVCALLFSGKPARTDSETGGTSASKSANVVFSCSEKRMAMLGIVEYPNQAQMNYCYLQYGSLEPTE